MEFTVSKGDLVRELNLSQGVVEKKTTIPILSNVLVEAVGDRINLTATDLELGIRSSCPARVKKPGAGTIPAKRLLDYVRLLPDADLDVKLQENQWASLVCGRSRTRIAGMSRESFPELAPDAGRPGADSGRDTGILDREDDLRHFDGGIALHAKRVAAAAEEQCIGDGGYRWPSPGHGGAQHGIARRDRNVSRAVAAQGHGRDL